MIKESGKFMGGGGRHGGGANSKNEKPGYMSHLSEQNLSANTPHSNSADSMTHQNLMGCAGGKEKYRGI